MRSPGVGAQCKQFPEQEAAEAVIISVTSVASRSSQLRWLIDVRRPLPAGRTNPVQPFLDAPIPSRQSKQRTPFNDQAMWLLAVLAMLMRIRPRAGARAGELRWQRPTHSLVNAPSTSTSSRSSRRLKRCGLAARRGRRECLPVEPISYEACRFFMIL